MSAALFANGAWRVARLAEEDIPRLQRFYEANPEYHRDVGGRAPLPDEARDDFHDVLPPEFPHRERWLLGFDEGGARLAAVADVISDLFAPGVWHIGFFMVDADLRGSGAAPAMYAGLERWMRDQGARWVRLGVVMGNSRAERFWEKCGYRELRRRSPYRVGIRDTTLRVMAKPLAGEGFAEYLSRVARDRPESP